jgi:putative ubiquitin-RnfH superfamily antitoxin RatB of RatAB toxin-antitoxin module
MTPEQALEVLKQLSALANAPLQAHINAQQAVEVLKKLIVDPKSKDKAL